MEPSSAQVAVKPSSEKHRGEGEPRLIAFPVWLKWLAVAGAYGLLWLPVTLVWIFVSFETGALSHEGLLLLAPVAFVAAPLLLFVVAPDRFRMLRPVLYLGLTILVTLALLGVFGAVAKTVFGDYFLDHPAPVLWSWATVLAISPPLAAACVLMFHRGEARAQA